jgi:hypothetical protein
MEYGKDPKNHTNDFVTVGEVPTSLFLCIECCPQATDFLWNLDGLRAKPNLGESKHFAHKKTPLRLDGSAALWLR